MTRPFFAGWKVKKRQKSIIESTLLKWDSSDGDLTGKNLKALPEAMEMWARTGAGQVGQRIGYCRATSCWVISPIPRDCCAVQDTRCCASRLQCCFSKKLNKDQTFTLWRLKLTITTRPPGGRVPNISTCQCRQHASPDNECKWAYESQQVLQREPVVAAIES